MQGERHDTENSGLGSLACVLRWGYMMIESDDRNEDGDRWGTCHESSESKNGGREPGGSSFSDDGIFLRRIGEHVPDIIG